MAAPGQEALPPPENGGNGGEETTMVVTQQAVEKNNPSQAVIDRGSSLFTWNEEKTDGVQEIQDLGVAKIDKQVGGTKWTEVVKKKEQLQQFSMEADEIEGVKVFRVPEAILNEAPMWDDCVLGKFLKKAPHVGSIHMTVNRIWTVGNTEAKIDVFVVNETTVKFRIADRKMRERVLRRKMWNIKDVPMLVSKWSPKEEEVQPILQSVPLWVVMKNVPRKLYNWKGLSFLASPIGVPKQLHPDTLWVKDFEVAKISVEVDLTKTLPKFHCFEIQGKTVEIQYEFPWLPPYCTNCDGWGHVAADCRREQNPVRILKRGSDFTTPAKSHASVGEGPMMKKPTHSNTVKATLPVETAMSNLLSSMTKENGKGISGPGDKVQAVDTTATTLDLGKQVTQPENTSEGTEWISPTKVFRRTQLDECQREILSTASRFSDLMDVGEEGEIREGCDGLEEEMEAGEKQGLDVDTAGKSELDTNAMQGNAGKTEGPTNSVMNPEGSRAKLKRAAKTAHRYGAETLRNRPATTNRGSVAEKQANNKKTLSQ
ncbi:hypothetical protein EUTSA_v10029223mg [Eutrema salsugineum]|uniref:DUF4283 domain-containing protein n=1 Tax=Eutrema salsugineum TaxID=72664 RepID=V4L419_EUTSA|nr:hypothetical protein EUTSA_v10029223mg [Eutrema salsugineum]